MKAVFGLLYAVLFFGYIVTALFIFYHIVRYSINRVAMIFGASLFIIVLGILLVSNAVIFFSLPIDAFIPKNTWF